MIPKKYQLTYTDATHIEMDRLVSHGHNIRDVLNAGIMLFKKATHQERGIAHMEAYSQPQKDFQEALDVILETNIDLLNPEHAKIAQTVRNLCLADHAQSESVGENIVDGAVNDAALKQLNKGSRTA